MTPGMKSFSLTFLDLLDHWNRRHSLTALPPKAREEELILDSLVLQPWVVALDPGARVAGRFKSGYNCAPRGDVAQLGERRVRNAKVGSSILLVSTTS